MKAPRLTIEQVLKWADSHHRVTRKWPTSGSGPVLQAPRESWANIDEALRRGYRGLRGKTSLALLLARRRGARTQRNLPTLTLTRILEWADRHYKRMGEWPTLRSGVVWDAPQEHWATINNALHVGRRGLPGNDSLAKLLFRRRGVPGRTFLSRLTIKEVLAWAKVHHRRTGKWPGVTSGRVVGADRLTWPTLNSALKRGWRGLPGGTSLARLLAKHR